MSEEVFITENAIIIDCYVFINDLNILDFCLLLKYKTGQQGLTGIALYSPTCKRDVCGYFIYKILSICDAKSCKEAIGKTVRVVHNDSKIYAIKHIIEDKCFIPEKDLKND